MIGVYVTVPIGCFRMGCAREYWETHPLPPPSTCYGFLLSLVGEEDRTRHIGCRVTVARLGEPDLSVVLRTLWRIKSKKNPPGVGNNRTPGHQQLLSGIELIVWLDSSAEHNAEPTLELRVAQALDPTRRGQVDRFGGLSLGESTHLVDTVSLLKEDVRRRVQDKSARVFLIDEAQGRMTLPVWVDHVGSAGTRYVTGDLVEGGLESPQLERMPRIQPTSGS
ncbi:MAG: type I-MYXAN CRISPR-associated protein Cas5/Cmx5/DevS [Planctomycetota bacterium]